MPSPEDIDRYIAAMQRLMTSQRHYLDVAARRLGLTPTQVIALGVIQREEVTKTTALSHMLDLSSGATTALLDRLEERGLIERHRSDVDRRVVLVSLAEKGHALIKRSIEQMRGQIEETLRQLDAMQLAQLLQGQEDLARAWEDVTAMQDRIAR